MTDWSNGGAPSHRPRRYGPLVHAVVVLAGLVGLLERWRRPGGRWVL